MWVSFLNQSVSIHYVQSFFVVYVSVLLVIWFVGYRKKSYARQFDSVNQTTDVYSKRCQSLQNVSRLSRTDSLESIRENNNDQNVSKREREDVFDIVDSSEDCSFQSELFGKLARVHVLYTPSFPLGGRLKSPRFFYCGIAFDTVLHGQHHSEHVRGDVDYSRFVGCLNLWPETCIVPTVQSSFYTYCSINSDAALFSHISVNQQNVPPFTTPQSNPNKEEPDVYILTDDADLVNKTDTTINKYNTNMMERELCNLPSGYAKQSHAKVVGMQVLQNQVIQGKRACKFSVHTRIDEKSIQTSEFQVLIGQKEGKVELNVTSNQITPLDSFDGKGVRVVRVLLPNQVIVDTANVRIVCIEWVVCLLLSVSSTRIQEKLE